MVWNRFHLCASVDFESIHKDTLCLCIIIIVASSFLFYHSLLVLFSNSVWQRCCFYANGSVLSFCRHISKRAQKIALPFSRKSDSNILWSCFTWSDADGVAHTSLPQKSIVSPNLFQRNARSSTLSAQSSRTQSSLVALWIWNHLIISQNSKK